MSDPTQCKPYLMMVRWPVGGIRTHLIYAQRLAEPRAYAYQPVVVAFDDSDTRLLLKNLAIPAYADYTQGVSSAVGMTRAALRACLRLPIQVVHSQGFTSALLAAPVVAATRKRHIVSVHDVVTDAVLKKTSRVGLQALGLTLRNAYAVHAVGEDCARSIRRLPWMAKASNIRIIENGIDSAQFSSPDPMDIHGHLRLPKETRLVGFFGRFMEQKGFTDLIEAVSLLAADPSVPPFAIVAVGSGGYQREYREQIDKKGLSRYFFFWPPVENPASLMAGCHLIAMPSLWEAYGLLAAEVLCLGVPLVASNCIGLREVVAGTPAKVIEAGQVPGLALALKTELLVPSLSAAQVYAPLAKRRFDFRSNAAQLSSLLEEAHLRK